MGNFFLHGQADPVLCITIFLAKIVYNIRGWNSDKVKKNGGMKNPPPPPSILKGLKHIVICLKNSLFPEFPYFWIDDVFVTGILVNENNNLKETKIDFYNWNYSFLNFHQQYRFLSLFLRDCTRIFKWPSRQRWECPIYNGTIKSVVWLSIIKY